MKSKQYNSIEEIYSKGILEDGEYYVCSVCKKKYKRKKNIDGHIEAQTCFKYHHVFRDTPTEERFYQWYRLSVALAGTRGFTMPKFRTSAQYSAIVEFYNFCRTYKIPDMTDYFKFVINEFKFEPLNSALLHGKTEMMFKRYRRNVGKYVNINRSEVFMDKNKKQLMKDTVFTLRSLEKGDISYITLFETLSFNKFVANLSNLEHDRFERFLESVQ